MKLTTGEDNPNATTALLRAKARTQEIAKIRDEEAESALDNDNDLYFDNPKKRAFLLAYCKTANISAACRAAQITVKTHYDWLKKHAGHEEYTEKFALAKTIANNYISAEARRRAIDGVERPIYQQGQLVGTEIVYSDTLLMMLLRGSDPDTYNKKSVEVSGKIDHNHTHAVALVPDWMLQFKGKDLADAMRHWQQDMKLGIAITNDMPDWARQKLILPAQGE